ncbi:MAG: hypothetical protein J6K74_05125 [Marinifilaceae bacterium]|nr:hypothetical protein [Marinifilaceae bacterium]
MSVNYVNTLIVRFKNEIYRNEIPLLRGAVLKAVGDDVELIFHNHTGDNTFRYKYPLIQYKRINKKAAIFCIGQGVEVIGQFFASQNFNLLLGEREINLEVESVIPKRILVQTWDSEFRYRVRNWIALNSENYTKYKSIESIGEQISFLENILIGNLLSFAKGMDITIEKEITCKLTSMETPKIVTAKGVKMLAFDVEFKTNLSIPDYMGIGKHVSLGYGTVVRNYDKTVK